MTYYSIILFAKVSPIIQNIFTYYSNNFTDYSSNLHLILTFNSIIVYVLSIRKGIRKISGSHMIIFALMGELRVCVGALSTSRIDTGDGSGFPSDVATALLGLFIQIQDYIDSLVLIGIYISHERRVRTMRSLACIIIRACSRA